MTELVAAFGLALAIEGLVCAAFPNGMRRAMADAAESSPERMRAVGIACAGVGVAIVWLARALLK